MENLDDSNNKNVSLSLIAEYGASDSESDDSEAPSIENMMNDESEESLELSEMVLKNNIINACAHGPLSSSNREIEETSRTMIIDNVESGVVEYEVTEYRDGDDSDSDSSSSSDSSDSDVDSVKDVEELSSSDENEAGVAAKFQPPKVQGELSLEDLPPIEDLAISLPAQETAKIGTIASIVDRLVIVRALPETPAVDLDSVLFLENGAKALGKVFDVFGPVTEPHYCVRFNSAQHMRARGVQCGMDVYIAPKTHHTNYVFLSQLMRMKGSDASWLNDVEPPPSQVEFSDDEKERRVKKQQKQNRQEQNQEPESDENTERSQARKQQEPRRNQRPSESSSRFGSGPSRGRNPFANSSRRNPNTFPRFGRPWPDMRTPPPHGDFPPFSAPPNFTPSAPLMFPPLFNPSTPPPFIGNSFQFGANPRMHGPPMGHMPPFRPNGPVFGSNYCNAGPQPQWLNNGHPPPPGT